MADLTEPKLPPLPEPTLEDHCWELWVQNVQSDFYTAEQMTTYATEAERLGYLRGLEEAAKVCVEQTRRWRDDRARFASNECKEAIRALAQKEQTK